MRLWLMPCPVIAAVVIACSDASQTVTGGDPQFDSSPDPAPKPPPDGGDAEAGPCFPLEAGNATWTVLYANVFGPTGVGQCGAASRGDSNGSSSCHHDPGGSGALSSNFICGDTQQSCYTGITDPKANGFGAQVVIPGDPCGSFLTQVLRHDGGGYMPFFPLNAVVSDDDMSRVATWIAQGAPNN
jgi:hypothetical protein